MPRQFSLGKSKSVSDYLFNIHTDTKAEEKEILEGFLQRLQYTNYIHDEREKPDFCVELQGFKIGVEITKYYSDFTKKGSRMQKRFMQWKKFAIDLKKIIDGKDSKYSNIYSSIHFIEKDVDYRILLKPEYIDEIIKALDIFQDVKYNAATLKLEISKFPNLSKIVNQLFFEYKNDDIDFLWWNSHLQSGEVKLDKNSLSNIILNKNNASKKYDTSFDQKWLIIYAAGHGLADIFHEFSNISKRQGSIMFIELQSENIELDPITYPVEESQYFDRILVWDKFHEKIFLVNPYFKKLFDHGEGKIWVNHLPHKTLKKPKH